MRSKVKFKDQVLNFKLEIRVKDYETDKQKSKSHKMFNSFNLLTNLFSHYTYAFKKPLFTTAKYFIDLTTDINQLNTTFIINLIYMAIYIIL